MTITSVSIRRKESHDSFLIVIYSVVSSNSPAEISSSTGWKGKVKLTMNPDAEVCGNEGV